MADSKISALTSLTGSAVAVADDVLPIVDTSVTTTKKITVAELFKSTFNALLNLSGASGGQIKFPSTQNPSSDVNTLDDYEEGTWTPSLGGNTTYSVQSGTYVKVGKKVFAQGQVFVTTQGTGSTTVISGLPFAAAAGNAQGGGSVSFFSNLASSVVWLGLDVASSSITVYSLTGAGVSASANAVFGDSARMFFQVSYIASA